MSGFLKKYLRATGGNVVMMFALALPALLAVIGLAVDYVVITKKYSALQAIADGAAVGSAHELPLANSNADLVAAVAKSYVNTNLGIAPPPPVTAPKMEKMSTSSDAGFSSGGSGGSGASTVSTTVEIVDKFTGVRVTLKET